MSETEKQLNAYKTEISRTLMKKIKALSKPELINKLLAMHNYGERQKAANLQLIAKVTVLESELMKTQKPADLESK